jgi:protein-S-isoprenylcysteine O-methyltransferase Ste14
MVNKSSIGNNSNYQSLTPILNGVTGALVICISLFIELRLPISKEISKSTGYILVAVGMLLVIWAFLQLKKASHGEVKPVFNILVKTGPYKYIRHPVYLGLTIALIGVALSMRSWLGLASVFILFLPTAIYRAKLEERELLKMFGERWKNYQNSTGFIFPFKRK